MRIAIVLLTLAGCLFGQLRPCAPVRHAKVPVVTGWNGPIFWKAGFLELEACSGTGLGFCAFLFNDAYGNTLRIVTAGEELQDPPSHAIVQNYKFVCERH